MMTNYDSLTDAQRQWVETVAQNAAKRVRDGSKDLAREVAFFAAEMPAWMAALAESRAADMLGRKAP